MAKYQLENGQTLNVPDDLDPTKRAQIAEDVKAAYGIDINQSTFLESASDKFKSVARGTIGIPTGGALGLAGLFDMGNDSKLVKDLQEYQDYLREDSSFASDPKFRDNYSTRLAEGAGSFLPFLGVGLAGRALANKGIVSQTTGQFGIPIALAAPTGIGQQVNLQSQAREMGEEVGPLAEVFSELFGGVIGASEVMPVAKFLQGVNKSVLKNPTIKQQITNSLKQFGTGAVTEGSQELLASLAQDLTARGLYSDELPIGESWFDELTIGGIIGGSANVILNAMGGKRGYRNAHHNEREAKARENKLYLQEQGKFERAIDQGEVTEFQQPITVTKPDIPIPGVSGTEPQLEITQLADGSYGVIDIQATENPVIASAPTETEALVLRDKQNNQYERDKLKSRLDNDLYSMGLSESDTAQTIGATVLDPNNTQINLQTLLNFDPKYKGAKKKKRIDTSGNQQDLADVKDYVEKTRKLPFKTTYTMIEAKKFLSTKAFNDLNADMAQTVFTESEKAGEPSIRADKEKLNITEKYLKELAGSKNIDLDVNSVAFDRFNEMTTGGASFKAMNRGQRELLLARIHSLPKFNSLTPLPDFRVREYTAQDMADFVGGVGKADFTYDDITTYLKDRFTGRQSKYYSSGLTQTEGGLPITLDQQIEFNDGILDEQVATFGSDLRTSGRAERPNKDNPRILRIRDNFEFDIARKAEAFGETPEQFGARLTSENKLPEETINQLIESERVRQEKVLPPVEIEPKIMNFAEVVEEGRTNKFATELKKRLNKLGLKETGVIVSNDILSSENLIAGQSGEIVFDPIQSRERKTEAQYDANTDTILLSFNAVNPAGTYSDAEIQARLNSIIDGQVIHAFRAKDLINEQEYNYLRNQVKSRKVPVDFDENFKGRTFYDRSKTINVDKAEQLTSEGRGVDYLEEMYVENAIADLYRAKDIKPDIPPKAKGIFGKFINFFKGMGTAMRSSGYKKSSDIFNDIEAGKIGSRDRGEIRTLRELDRLPIAAELAPIAEIDETVDETIDETSEITQEEINEFDIAGATFSDTKNTNFKAAKNEPIKGRIIAPPKGTKTTRTVSQDGLYDSRKLTTEEKLEDAEFILNNTENKNLIGVMEWFVKNAPSKDYGFIAQAVLKQLKMLNTKFNLNFDYTTVDESFLAQKTTDDVIRQDITYLKKNKRTLGGVSMYPKRGATGYDGQFRVYIMNVDGNNSVDFETILHEAIHAATQGATTVGNPKNSFVFGDSDSKLRSNFVALEKLRKRVQSEIRKSGQVDFFVKYGVKNVDELLAVGLTNRQFQKFMEGIEYNQQGQKTLWDAFVNGVRQLLGLRAKQGTALSVFLKESSGMLSLETDAAKKISNYFTPNQNQSPGPELDPLTNRGPPQKEVIETQIRELESRLYDLNNVRNREGGAMSNANLGRLNNQITQVENKIQTLQDELNNLPPEQRDLFSPFQPNLRSPNPNIGLQKAVESAEELSRKTPRGDIPPYNLNASDVALEAAQNFVKDLSPREIKLPKLNIEVPAEFSQQAKQSGHKSSTQTSGERFINIASDPITSIKKTFNGFRQGVIDSLDPIQKGIVNGIETNEEVRLANNLVSTSTMASLRLADRARGVFAQMLTRGIPAFQIKGADSLTLVEELEIDTKYNPFIEGNKGTGGLMQITAPLYADPTVDLEYVFGLYSKLKRIKTLKDNGVEIPTPPSLKDLEQIKQIENNYKSVVEVYNNYQKWNNGLINFAKAKGLLSAEQAKQWTEHSSYYPFYREMIDDEGRVAPAIGGGYLPNNPLSIKMKGSEEEITVPPLEAIARNSLSILTASMKNDGVGKLIRDMETMKMAREIPASQTAGLNTIFVFKDGVKKHFLLDDPEIYYAVQSVGGIKTDALTKFFAMPAGFLRDMVTRDPGFVVVNILRDTLSSAVTSGVELGIDSDSYTPIIDSVANMFGDMQDLEKFGIIGGYDFANDEGDIVQFMARTRRQQGLSPENGISAENAFFKIWDGLGGLTTKSDGATRKAVYDSVYKNAIKNGETEAEAQSAAAYQALEIINFGRRGSSPTFKLITAAIPFLNARIQGLDVLYRSFSGQYSATEKLQKGETMQDVKNRIAKTALLRGLSLMGITALYYLLVSDTEDYKEAKREIRDDNWLIPTPWDYTVKIPIPFEVGMIFKALPERVIDMAWGQVEKDPMKSITRQIATSTKIPVIGGDISIQAVKPLFEAITNRSAFTGTEIVPYYKLGKQGGYQSNPQTNELARLIGEALNISPIKIEYVLKGYTGTLGGYALSVADSITRTATGSPYIPNNAFNNPTNWSQLPVFKRLLVDTKKMGGLQQQFYELRGEVNKVTQTMNSLKKDKRFDELATYRANYQGVMNVKGQVRALERYLENWRKKRDAVMRRDDISVVVKSDLVRELEMQRDQRLAFVPELRKKANVPVFQGGL